MEIGYNIYSDTKIAAVLSSDTRPILLRNGRVFFVYKVEIKEIARFSAGFIYFNGITWPIPVSSVL